MGTIAGNLTSPLLPVAVKQMSSAFAVDSQTAVRTMDLNEARQLSQFATIIVLVPVHSADGEGFRDIPENNPISGSPATLKVLEVFNKTTSQTKSRRADGDFVFGEVKVDFATMEVSRGGEPMILTTLEFKFLKYLIQNARRVISRDELLNEVWGYETYPCTRTVDNHILRLRRKLERAPSRPVHFLTVHGSGYKFLP